MFYQLRCGSVWARVELGRIRANLLQGFIVEKAAGIFRQVQLLTLDLLSEFPTAVSIQDRVWKLYESLHVMHNERRLRRKRRGGWGKSFFLGVLRLAEAESPLYGFALTPSVSASNARNMSS